MTTILGLDEDEHKFLESITIRFMGNEEGKYELEPLLNSQLINRMFEFNKDHEAIPLEVKKEHFDMVYKFLDMYRGVKNIPEVNDLCACDKTLKNLKKNEYVGSNSVLPSEKDINYITQYNSVELFNMINTADYLIIPSLVKLCCLRIASFLYPHTVNGSENKDMIKNILTGSVVEN